MTLYEKLIAEGLPVESATEEGSVIWQRGVPVSYAQVVRCSDIIIEHTNPTWYPVMLRIRERYQNADAEAKLATQIRTMTVSQAVTWIENNVVDLPTAKTALKITARVLMALWDRNFPDHAE